MKFYEICLGKITSVTEIDVNEDQYMMNLTIQTYIGICESALKLGLSDRMIHFATQGIKLDVKNISNTVHIIYLKRAQTYMNLGKLD